MYEMVPGRMREARENAGLSQSDVDRKTREMGSPVSKTSVGRYERGQVQPTLEAFLTLCKLYRVNPSWVLTGSGMVEWASEEAWKADQRQVAEWFEAMAQRFRRAADEGVDLVGKVEPPDMAVRGEPLPEPDTRNGRRASNG